MVRLREMAASPLRPLPSVAAARAMAASRTAAKVNMNFLMLLKRSLGAGGCVGLRCRMRIVDGIVQTARLLALESLAHHEIGDVDDVAQLAELTRGFRAAEEVLGLLIEDVGEAAGNYNRN